MTRNVKLQELDTVSKVEEYALYPIAEIQKLYLIKVKYETLLQDIESLRLENLKLKQALNGEQLSLEI